MQYFSRSSDKYTEIKMCDLEPFSKIGSHIYLSEELQETIKNHPSFTAPPMEPIGDYIVSEELHCMIPQSFATSYLVHSGQDVSILREIVAAHGESHPAVIVYPRPDVKQSKQMMKI